MTAVLIVGIIFGSLVAIFAIIFGFLLMQKRFKMGGGSFREGEQLNADETRLIQELHQGLTRMEERIGALETIVLDREAQGQKEREGDRK
jgi:phage shock protein B